jgi:hypothetical protein
VWLHRHRQRKVAPAHGRRGRRGARAVYLSHNPSLAFSLILSIFLKPFGPSPLSWRSSACQCSRDALTRAWPQVSVGDMRVFLDSNWEPPLLPAEKDWILQRSHARCLLAVCAGRARSRIQIVQPGLRPSSRTRMAVCASENERPAGSLRKMPRAASEQLAR